MPDKMAPLCRHTITGAHSILIVCRDDGAQGQASVDRALATDFRQMGRMRSNIMMPAKYRCMSTHSIWPPLLYLASPQAPCRPVLAVGLHESFGKTGIRFPYMPIIAQEDSGAQGQQAGRASFSQSCRATL